MINLKQHALCAIFPALLEDDLKALATDIKEHGLKQSIVLYKGEILDGWHRYLACQAAKVNPRTMDYNGDDPRAFVRSANWHRRHLNASQRALAEIQLSEWRQEGKIPKTADTPSREGVKSAAEMATEAQVGHATIERAKAVEVNGTDELKEAVKGGKISVKRAAKIARLPKAKQAKAIKEPAKKTAKPEHPTVSMAEHKKLQDQHAQLLVAYEDLSDEIKAEESSKGDAKNEILKLVQENKRLTRRRDELMNKCSELEKQCRMWRSKYEKLAKAK